MSIPNTVVVLPFPAQGHVNSFMNLSRKLAEHGFKIIFVNSDFIHELVMASFGESQETFIMESSIKLVSIPDGLGSEEDRKDGSKLIHAIAKNMPASLEKLIEDVNGSCNGICCIVADVNMGWALEVARKMGIRRAAYFTFAAATFALLPSIPRLSDDGIIDFNGTPIKEKTFQLSPNMPIMHTDQLWSSNIGDPETEKHVFHYSKDSLQILN
ncbi:hypothetical protein L6164_007541 [Bauhinia variegata]|uniref:Uncharacterized protein n=1 Tax=Bauhinia variegata TaxID=167791 RepID=A0ACB9PDS2_BAUVA|nr:hypothetical protein L6164_007541 [Bauhinia variegata]